jgi:hypothetical protein
LSDKKSKLSIFEIVLRGTIIATIISVPSLTSFVLIWVIFDDLILGIIVGIVIHFIAMGFSLKISKKLLLR